MPKLISAAESRAAARHLKGGEGAALMRVVLVTMDSHLASAAERALAQLQRTLPSLQMRVHAASDWASDTAALERCLLDIGQADIVIVTMLFMEDHFLPVLPALQARREQCDAMVCLMSASEVSKLTRMGKFDMQAPSSAPMEFLKKLRGKSAQAGQMSAEEKTSAGEKQMKMLRRLPKILRFIPGTAQDVRAYFLAMQYWLAGSQDNIQGLVSLLIDRYASGPRAVLRGLKVAPPVEYPEVGVYHPRLQAPGVHRLSDRLGDLPRVATSGAQGTVGVLLLRSYVLAGNTSHYDGVIAALEARGLRVIPAFASGLDNRPAIGSFFMKDGRPAIDALVSLTGFSLVGGPAYNDSRAAQDLLAQLDIPYLAVAPVEFQTLDSWGASERGFLPVEATMMVSIPELDGATGNMVYGGRGSAGSSACTGCSKGCRFESVGAHDMNTCSERANALSARVARLISLRRSSRAERKVGAILFNFPPNAGATGTAAFLGVFESLYNTLAALKREGYTVDMPESVEELRERLIKGNAERYGAMANVHAFVSADDHVRREKYLKPIEAAWGPAPGRLNSDGSRLFVLGERFGNVFVGLQPGMGYEGDPMRLLFEKGLAPTHAFSAFYRWLREDFGAHALLHFGTHGALEFMPGKQTGLSADCWPDRLIGDMPNFYLYASNNPSEGTVAKRRSAATLISYLTPPVSEAGLYKGLNGLKELLERYRSLDSQADQEAHELVQAIQAQAAALDLVAAEPAWDGDAPQQVQRLSAAVLELAYTLIPEGLHVVGQPMSPEQLVQTLGTCAKAWYELVLPAPVLQLLAQGGSARQALDLIEKGPADGHRATLEQLDKLVSARAELLKDNEIAGIVHALDGGFLRPAPGGDLLRTSDVLPTGRNVHGFDPFRIPSAYAVKDGARQAQRLLERYQADGHGLPESIAMVLWGTDNLKSEGGPIAQALALMGARPRFDSYGRLAGAELMSLVELGRPRVDVVISLSGIFRDLLPLQIKLLAEAAFLAASADEAPHENFIRKHALAYQAEHGCDLETAALRVFGNAEGAYGANVNLLIDNSRWDSGDELAETYSRRKGFAYGRAGKPVQQGKLLASMLADVELAYQNLDSVELGVTTVDTYFDTLGGVSRAIARAKTLKGAGPAAAVAPVYIGDQTRDSHGGGTVRTLGEQVALETRTRMLNPKWYEGMLKHGYEGVRQLEVHLTNTMGWSATTGQVQPWVYEQLTQAFVLDAQMRQRLAELNPTASARLAHRLIEASDRQYWQPDPQVLQALRQASEELEDRLEGVYEGATA
jgi:magnesium chelatase subunit H